MGVSHIMVNYPYVQDYHDFANHAAYTGDMKLVNWNWPSETFKYLESGYREIFVGDVADQWVAPEHFGWGQYTQNPNWHDVAVLASGPFVQGSTGNAHDMWVPTMKLGGFRGWADRDGLLSPNPDSANMRWHIRVWCDATQHGGSSNDPILGVTWYVSDKRHNQDGFWSYPECVVRLSDFSSLGNDFENREFTIDPATSQAHTFWNYDCNTAMFDSTFIHRFDGFREVCMKIHYYGAHDVYIRKVDVYDEGYWRMMVSPDSAAVQNAIGQAFQANWDSSQGTVAGWYYDEWPSGDSHHIDTQVRSIVKVNKIIQAQELPTIFMNGNPHSPTNPRPYWTLARDDLYREMALQNVSMPIQMNEFYFTGNGTVQPSVCGGSSVEFLKTDSTSNGAYIDVNFADFCNYQGASIARWEGHKSLQCALDVNIWGDGPVYRRYPTGSSDHLIEDIPADVLWADSSWFALDYQIRFDHQHGNRSWGMVATAVDNTDSTGAGGYFAPIRTPVPGEVKLGVWLSVACDADGIIYYPFGPGGSTLVWDSLCANCWNGALCRNPVNLQRTPNYWAAAHADSEVLRIAPVLEPLRYVKTYASRRYEQNYGSMDNPRDTLIASQTNPSTISQIQTDDHVPPSHLDDDLEDADSTYIQVSRFMAAGADPLAEDYWFLVVNRRALHDENRIAWLTIDNVRHPSEPYFYEAMLAESARAAFIPAGGSSERRIAVTLGPGEGDLLHFYRADTTDLVITTDTTIYAPAYFHRNIIVQGNGNLTIGPRMSALRDSFLVGSTWQYRYDSVAAVTFWRGKGIRTVQHSSDSLAGLHILGSDTTHIRLQAADANAGWAGVQAIEAIRGNIEFRYVDIQNAPVAGLAITGGVRNGYWDTPYAVVDHCSFRNCGIGLALGSRANVHADYSTFATNTSYGVSNTGSTLQLNHSQVLNNKGAGVYAVSNAICYLTQDSIAGNAEVGIGNWTVAGGITAWGASVWLKCCNVVYNHRCGIGAYNSTVGMADPGQPTPRWGWNRVEFNAGDSLQISAPSSALIMDNGQNRISGLTQPSNLQWIYYPNVANCPHVWRQNYWVLTDTGSIHNHLPSGVTLRYPLNTWSGCQSSSQGEAACAVEGNYVDGKSAELSSQFATARSQYQAVIVNSGPCQYTQSVSHDLIATDILAHQSASSVGYFESIADTATSRQMYRAAMYGDAWSLAFSGDLDKANDRMQTMLSSALTDTEKVEAQIELLNLGLMSKASSPTDSVAALDLVATQDSINYLIASLSKWTRYSITDSVVMYAPCTVDSAIDIHEGAVLVIKPTPGIKPAVVTFKPGADIWVEGFNTPTPRGRLYVQGEADSPVTLHWDTTSSWANIESTCGQIVLSHAVLEGAGWVSCNDNPMDNPDRFPIFRADSCTFRSFSEGLWFWGRNDTTSYLSNCLLENMGAGGDVSYNGFGTALTNMEYSTMRLDNCQIINGGGVGVFNYYYSDMDIAHSSISGNKNYGILNWETGDLSLECSDVSINGDTTADVWVEDGTVNLVGGHTELSDTGGVVIYAADPSMVDLGDGENYLKLGGGTGYYLKSGDTTDTWDISMNTWTPFTPLDTAFYSHLWPHTPGRWLVDTSLVTFVGCDQGGTMSVGGGAINLLIPGDNDRAGEDSWHGSGPAGADVIAVSSTVPIEATKLSSTGMTASATKVNSANLSATKTPSLAKAAPDRAEMLRMHHQELNQWRSVKVLTKNQDKVAAAQATMNFVRQFPGSKFVPAAMVNLTRMARKGDADQTVSKFLMAQSNSLIEPSQKKLAKRLSFVAKAAEGKPSEALSGLEEMMETAQTPRDSLRALADAMGVCFFNRHDRSVRPRNEAVRCADIRSLVQRVTQISRMIDNPALIAKNKGPAVPLTYALYQNYPNPFNPNTEIRFDLPDAVRVELKVFNILGQEVAKLVDEVRPAGAYRVMWDSKTTAGTTVASGVYIYQLKAGKFTDAKKMMLIR
jgi:hypothetical protein